MAHLGAVSSTDGSGKKKGRARRRGKRVWEYVRVSTAREKMISPELQAERTAQLVRSEGLTSLGVVEDLDRSGRDFAKRQIGRLIESVRAGEADGIVVWAVSRWGRSLETSLTHVRELENAGGYLLSATESLDDIETPFGRFALTQLLAMAELQSNQLRAGWLQVQERRRALGLAHNTGSKFGYVYDPEASFQPLKSAYAVSAGEVDANSGMILKGIHVPDGPNAEALAYAYREFTAGRPMRQILAELDADGIRNALGNPLRFYPLRHALDSGFGAGLLSTRADTESAKSLREDVADLSTYAYSEGAHEPVITRDEWLMYVERREARATKRPRLDVSKWSGLLVCASCRSPMRRGRTGRRKYMQWRCTNRDKYIVGEATVCKGPVTILESQVAEQMNRWLDELPGALQASDYRADEFSLREHERRVKSLERAASRARDEMKRLTRELSAGQIDRDVVLELISEASDKRKRAENDLASLRSRTAPVQPPSFGEIDALGLLLNDNEVDQVLAHRALSAIVRRIVVHTKSDAIANAGGDRDALRLTPVGVWEDAD